MKIHRMGQETAPETPAGAMVSERWVEWRRSVDLDKYDARWEAMAARGESVHGEADAIDRLAAGMSIPVARVLDAGCGTGRLAIELARRGYEPTGVDLDPDMIERARRKAPHISWHVADLAAFVTENTFDLVVLAGNIPNFCAPGAQRAIVANLAGLLRPGGRIVCGWSQEERPDSYHGPSFVSDGESVGLRHVNTWSNWEGDEASGTADDYAVVVMER
jgi:SAM-dependent methyltransferase